MHEYKSKSMIICEKKEWLSKTDSTTKT